MPNPISCPSAQDLQRLLLGQVPEPEAERLEEHLEQCDPCVRTASTLKAEDTLAEAIRTQGALSQVPPGEVVEGLMQRLEQFRPATLAPDALTSGATIRLGDTPPEGTAMTAALSEGAPFSEEATLAAPMPSAAVPSSEATEMIYDFLAPAQRPNELGRLGSYRVLKVLGAGGMGVVFQAEDPHLDRLVALKAMLPALASNPSARQRFLREARAAAAIEHDHIVHINQVGEERGVPFLAMPLLKGEPLDERLKRNHKLPLSEVLRIGREVAEGLAAAHEHGLVHRDIKPGNIWLEGSRARVKILDFGLARAAADTAHLTQSGAIVGTPAYMAPEQTRGGSIDHRADLFSLGCVLYRLSTGELPFKGMDTMSILAALALDNPPPPRDLDPTIPPAFSDLVMQLLAKKPEDRPPSALAVVEVIQALEREQAADADVREALMPVRRGEAKGDSSKTLLTQRAGSTPSFRLPRIRSRRWAVLAALVLLSILGGAGYLFAPALYRIVTNRGELVIETVDPDVEVTIKQGGQVVQIIDPKTQQKVILQAGTYRVELPVGTRDHLALSTDHFTLDRNGHAIVKVSLNPPPKPGFAEAVPDVRPAQIRGFAATDKPITQDGVTPDQNGWRIDSKDKRTVRLFEVPNPGVDDCLVLYRAQMKTAGVEGRAYLEMWCRLPEKGEFFSKGFLNAVQGTTDWASSEIPFRLEKGQRPDLIKLNVVIEGKGTVWIKDVELLHIPLPEVAGGKPIPAAVQKPSAVAGPVPLDSLRREQIPAYELAMAGGGDPAKAPAGLVAILGDSRLKHWRAVTSVAFSPDGKTLASGSWDFTIKLWVPETGKEQRTLTTGDGVRCVAFSPDGKSLACGDNQGNVKTWDPDTGKELQTLSGKHGMVGSLSFRADGQVLACANGDGTVTLWDTGKGKERATLTGHKGEVQSVAFSPDGKTLASGGADGAVRLWDMDAGKERRTLGEHQGGVFGVAYSSDGKTLASAGADGAVRLWDMDTGKERRTLAGAGTEVFAVAFSPDGKTLASGDAWARVRLWDLAAATQPRLLTTGPKGPVHALAFSPDSKMLASGNENQTINLWETDTGKERLASAGNAGSVWSAAFSPDGKVLATGSWDNTAKLWDAATGKELHTLTGHGNKVSSVAFSPDGEILVTGSADGLVKVWDRASAKELLTLAGHKQPVTSVAFSPDGKTLASGSWDGTVKLWQADSGQEIRTLSNQQRWVLSVAFNLDGKIVAAGTYDAEIKLWETDTGKPLATLTGFQGSVNSVAYSPDGQLRASGSSDGVIRVSKAATDKPMPVLKGHQGAVYSVSFRPDSRVLSSSSADGTVRFWDLGTGDEKGSFRLCPAGGLKDWGGLINQVAFSPDGRYLATANGNGTVYILRLEAPGDKANK